MCEREERAELVQGLAADVRIGAVKQRRVWTAQEAVQPEKPGQEGMGRNEVPDPETAYPEVPRRMVPLEGTTRGAWPGGRPTPARTKPCWLGVKTPPFDTKVVPLIPLDERYHAGPSAVLLSDGGPVIRQSLKCVNANANADGSGVTRGILSMGVPSTQPTPSSTLCHVMYGQRA